VEGRRSVWDIEAKDDVEVIGRGTHERFAVDFAKFNARVAKKAAGA
jgi:fluoroacetyl-CoA thioesterase